MADEREISNAGVEEDEHTEADLSLGTDAESDQVGHAPLGPAAEPEPVLETSGSVSGEDTEYELCVKEDEAKPEHEVEPENRPSLQHVPLGPEPPGEVDESSEVTDQVEEEEEEEGAGDEASLAQLDPEAEQNVEFDPEELTAECSQPTASRFPDTPEEDGRDDVDDIVADLEVGMSSELGPLRNDAKPGQSPTPSLAEEDQTETDALECDSKSTEQEACEETMPAADATGAEVLVLPEIVCNSEDVTSNAAESSSVQGPDIQPQEPDDPECDLASSVAYQRTGSYQVTEVDSSNNAGINSLRSQSSNSSLYGSSSSLTDAPKQTNGSSASSHVKEALGLMLKQGIRSAAKDTAPIRGVLGQLQQGLKTAISETTTFLEGNSAPQRAAQDTLTARRVTQVVSSPSVVESPTTNSSSHSNGESGETPPVNNIISYKDMEKNGGDGAAGDSSALSDVPEDELLSQLDAELDIEQTVHKPSPQVNGVIKFDLHAIPEVKELRLRNEQLQKDLQYHKDQCVRLRSVNDAQDVALQSVQREADQCRKQLKEFQSKAGDDVFVAQIRALELTIANQQKEISQGKERLDIRDKAAKEAISRIQSESKAKLDQLQSLADARRKDKEDMVLKYAKAEAKNIEMENKMSKNDGKMKEMMKERESVMSKFKALKADQVRCRDLFEARSTEVLQQKREIEKLRELLVSQEGKTKWAHNKLKMEMDQHKETKAKLEESVKKNKVSRDEAEQIRKDCQSMIKCYQESEEIKSNSLDIELKQKETQLILHRQDKIDQEEMHSLVRRELETLKMKHKEMLVELTTWRDKVKCLDSERIVQEHNLDKYRETLQKQKETNAELEKRLSELEDIEQIVLQVQGEIDQVKSRNRELELECNEMRSDMDKCATREQEHLLFTQKISDKNAHLQSENTGLQNKVTGFSAEVDRLSELSESLKIKKQKLEKELASLKKEKEKNDEGSTAQLQEKTKAVERLATDVDDLKNEIKTLKRKHAANTKDLTRQLQNSKRRLESLEPKDAASSMGSRTSSNGSLDTVNHMNNRPGNSSNQTVDPEPEPFVQVVEVDKQMLIEKIVRLQKAHARKNEKLEFLEDHIQQLFAEVQKKNKIIQNYALREEAGTISSEATDWNKALLAKKSGIMSSLYNAQQTDGAMTLDLSLDISRKLQAVLEDTLLKNITLKENLDTLGEEIARLSQENRQIKLKEHPCI